MNFISFLQFKFEWQALHVLNFDTVKNIVKTVNIVTIVARGHVRLAIQTAFQTAFQDRNKFHCMLYVGPFTMLTIIMWFISELTDYR